jgi:antitoxin FitA
VRREIEPPDDNKERSPARGASWVRASGRYKQKQVIRLLGVRWTPLESTNRTPNEQRPSESQRKLTERGIDMFCACKYAECMAVMVQIRNMPSELHRELKARAALEGMSLSDYLLRELRHAVDRPTLDEMRRRLERRRPVRLRQSTTAAVRAERDSR